MHDYLTTPVDPDLLRLVVGRVLAVRGVHTEVSILRERVRELETSVDRPIPRRAIPSTPPNMPPIPGSKFADIEKFAVLETLKATNGSTSKAAKMLGLSTRTIQYRLGEYQETVPRSFVRQGSEKRH